MVLENELTQVDGIGQVTAVKLHSAGITTVVQLAALTPEELSELEGFSPATSQKIIENAQNYITHNGISGADTNLEKPRYKKSTILEQVNDNDEMIFNELEDPILYANNVEEVSLKQDNIPFITQQSENMTHQIQKEQKKPQRPAFIPYEEVLSDDLNGEKLSKSELNHIKEEVAQKFRNLGYYIIDKKSSMFRSVLKDIDFLAYKVMDITKMVGILTVYPVIISHLRGTLVVTSKDIIYNPTSKSVKYSKEFLKIAQKGVLDNVLNEKTLFKLFKKLFKKLKGGTLIITKARNGKAIFINSGQIQYKIIVNPVLACLSEPAFIEKSIMLPYQRKTNIHAIQFEAVDLLVKFLEKKYFLLESQVKQNAIEIYDTAKEKLRVDLKRYSIPFPLYGVIFLLVILFQNIFLLTTFTNLGYAALGIYGFLFSYVILRFTKTQKKLTEDYRTPYHRKKVEMDETDINIIKDDLTAHELDQFIYECFGKNSEFSYMLRLEEGKVAQLEKDILTYGIPISHRLHNEEIVKENIPNKEMEQEGKENAVREKMISKYSDFLED